jgi:hypothetical protein
MLRAHDCDSLRCGRRAALLRGTMRRPKSNLFTSVRSRTGSAGGSTRATLEKNDDAMHGPEMIGATRPRACS